MIKIVFFDIDGTLVSFKTHKVPASTIEAIAILREKGVKLFISTGRHRATIDNLGDLQFDGYVTMNGAYCFSGDEVIFKQPIPKSNIDNLISLQQNGGQFPVFFLAENSICANYFNKDTDELIEMINFPVPPIMPLESIAEKEIFQRVSFFDEKRADGIMAHLPDCCDARWYHTFTDITHKSTSKMVGVGKVLEYYGFSADEAVAFGDGGNDTPMLKAVTHSVAMGNAADEVKRVASFVTKSVDEDGIWHALKHFSLI